MTWLTITAIIAGSLAALLLVWVWGWKCGYLRAVKWTTKYLIDDMADLDDQLREFIEESIPPDVKARLAALRGDKPAEKPVKAETMAEIRKAQDAKNENQTERQQQPD